MTSISALELAASATVLLMCYRDVPGLETCRMSTTTLRLSDELKARVAQMAEQAGTTAHAFMLNAIVEKTATDEQRRAFENMADARYAKIVESGETISWTQMRSYLKDRLADPEIQAPTVRKLAG